MPFSGEIWEDEVDICARLILKTVRRVSEMSAHCLTCVIRPIPLKSETRVSYKEDTDFVLFLFKGWLSYCVHCPFIRVHTMSYL